MSETTADTNSDYTPTPLSELLGTGARTAPVDTSGHDVEAGSDAEPVTGETPVAPVALEPATPAVEEPKDRVPVAALTAERAKRQELERRIAEMQAQMEATKAQPAPEQLPNPASDPAGYHAAIQRTLLNERMNVSETIARTRYADLDEKVAAFREEAEKNPALAGQLFAQPDPYGWAYEQGRRILAMKEIGPDPAAFREKVASELRATIRAELLAELGVANAEQPDDKPAVPVTLATARSAPTQANVYRGPPPLKSLLRMG
jgi:hypothetical protein